MCVGVGEDSVGGTGVGETTGGPGTTGAEASGTTEPILDDSGEGPMTGGTSATDSNDDGGSEDDSGSEGSAGRCGNAVIDVGEVCDDGRASRACNAWCQVPGSVLWEDEYDATSNDRAYDVSVADDGGFVAVGFTGTQSDILIRSYGPDGAASPPLVVDAGGNDRAWGVDHDDQGNYYVVGYVGLIVERPWAAMVAPDGTVEWEETDDQPGQWWSVSVGTDGIPVAVGERRMGGDGEPGNLLARAWSEGQSQWTYSHVAFGNSVGHGVAQDGDVLTVVGQYSGFDDQGLVLQLSASAGSYISDMAIPSTGSGRTLLSSIARDGDDFAIVGTADTNSNGWQMWYGSASTDGEPWNLQMIGDTGNDELFDVDVDEAGNRYVCGFETNGDSGQDAFVRKYSPDGNNEWTWGLAGDLSGSDRCWGLELAPDGTLIIAGYREVTDGDYDVWVRRLAR